MLTARSAGYPERYGNGMPGNWPGYIHSNLMETYEKRVTSATRNLVLTVDIRRLQPGVCSFSVLKKSVGFNQLRRNTSSGAGATQRCRKHEIGASLRIRRRRSGEFMVRAHNWNQLVVRALSPRNQWRQPPTNGKVETSGSQGGLVHGIAPIDEGFEWPKLGTVLYSLGGSANSHRGGSPRQPKTARRCFVVCKSMAAMVRLQRLCLVQKR